MKMISHIEDTIAAIATAKGEAGIGVIRVSGNLAFEILAKLCRLKSLDSWEARKLYFKKLYSHSQEILDQVLCFKMIAPSSFTGEDVVEIQAHGGSLILEIILEQILEYGARLAEPGEFTFRAYWNEKIDLNQAEAIGDVIHAKSELALKQAKWQLDGRLSQKVDQMRDQLLHVQSRVELSLDFSEEDVEFLDLQSLLKFIDPILKELKAWQDSFQLGNFLKEGLRLVLLGKPNAGKSSLFNLMLHTDKAIIDAEAGTTRDLLEGQFTYRGAYFQIFDTAGLRQSEGRIEQEGIRRAKAKIQEADCLLCVLDPAQGLQLEKEFLESDKAKILILNKMDLAQNQKLLRELNKKFSDFNVQAMSALKGEGAYDLKEKVFQVLKLTHLSQSDMSFSLNQRHRQSIEDANFFLCRARENLRANLHLDCVAQDIRETCEALSHITGQIDNEDVLSKIFSEFCIGK